MLDIILLIAGFALLIWGAEKLVEGASSLARRYRIPEIVIGLTIVAFGTSSPEMVVNLFAAVGGNTDMALGNVVGSNIFNILGILGISALIYPLAVKNNTTWFEIPLSLLAGLILLVSASDVFLDVEGINIISRSDGIVFLFFFIIFLVYNLQLAKTNVETDTIVKGSFSALKSALFIFIGLACLIGGGKMIVNSAVSLASMAGISQRVISLTIVSIGTSLPELATSVIAVRKRKLDIAIGNVVGSNIFNIFFILGVSTVIRPLPSGDNSHIDMGLNILASFLLFIFIFTGKGRRLERLEGAFFILLYTGYLVYLIIT